MKVKALGVLKSKLLKLKPCRKLLFIFELRLKKPVFIRAFRKTKSQDPFKSKPKPIIMSSSSFLSVFRSPKKSRDMTNISETERLTNSPSMNVPESTESKIFPSPLTPAYAREGKEVEEACRRFEKYLVEMIVEEGKTIDLMDVEELLHCWKNLKSPVFIDLVSRFYGELCKDLFSSHSDQEPQRSHSCLPISSLHTK